MFSKALTILFFTAALSAPQAYAGQDYIVTLTNGNTLTANSYRVEGRKVYLKYPVGEVAIPESEVASVAGGGGNVELLQIHGELKPGPSGSLDAAPVQKSPGLPPPDSEIAGQPETGAPVSQDAIQPVTVPPVSPGTTGPDEAMDSRDKRSGEISGAVSGAVPVSGGNEGVSGDQANDYDPVADSLAQQLSTADDNQAAEITKQLNALSGDAGVAEVTKQQ